MFRKGRMSMMRSSSPYWDSIRTSLGMSLSFTASYCGLVTIGALLTEGRSLSHFGRSPLVILGFHFLAAVFVGVLAGSFSRWATSSLRGGVLGTLICAPVAFATYVVFRPEFSIRVMLISAAISALLLGGTVGWLVARPIDGKR
jgi:hypothetical protein